MLKITERTTRLVCRIAFVAGCVVPMLLVLVISLWQMLPFETRAMERHLTATLGLRASLADLQTPRMDRLRLLDLRLHDPESNALVATVEQIDACQLGNELIVWMQGVHVAPTGTEALEELVLRRVRRRLAPDAPVVRMVVSDLAIETSQETLRFARGTIHLDPFPNGAQARLRLVSENEKSDAIRLRIFRRFTPDDGMIVEWENQHDPLPCRVIAALLPPELLLGDEATFCGAIRLEQTLDNWRGELQGTLEQIDLSQVGQFAGEALIDTRGTLTFERAQMAAGRLQIAQGSLSCDGGDVDAVRLTEIADTLRLRTDFLTREPDARRLPFEKLAFRFQLDEHGLRLAGQCDDSQTCLIADVEGPLLVGPDTEPREIGNLVEALVDRSNSTLGETSSETAADRLARRLPKQRQPIVETANREERRFE